MKSWADSTGSGIPDWWLQYYFGTNWANIDPYSIAAGDGWTVLQKYQNGWNPTSFYTPPAPTGLAAGYYGSGANVTVSWNSSPGPVLYYTVYRSIPALGTDGYFNFTNLTAFLDALPDGSIAPDQGAPTYWAMAHYAGGDSPWSGAVSIYLPELYPDASVVRGPQGHLYLVTGHLPESVATVRVWATSQDDSRGLGVGGAWYPPLYEANYLWETPQSFTNAACCGYWETNAPALQSGFVELPASLAAPYGAYVFKVQTVATNGASSDYQTIQGYAHDDWNWQFGAVPFLDGRRQIQQNVEFQLRAAQGSGQQARYAPLLVHQGTCIDGWWSYSYNESASTNYVSAGFHHSFSYGGDTRLVTDAFRPFEQNYFYANFLTNGSLWGNVSYGDIYECTPCGCCENRPTGLPYTPGDRAPLTVEVDQPAVQFSVWDFVNTAGTNFIPSLLSSNAARWIFTPFGGSVPNPLNFFANSEPDQYPGSAGHYTVYADFPNLYGLNLRSVRTINCDP